MINVGFLTIHNPMDRNSFSGTVFYMYQALEKRSDVNIQIIGLTYHQKKEPYRRLFRQIIAKLLPFQMIKSTLSEAKRKQSLQSYVECAERELKQHHGEYDIILAPFASQVIHKIPLQDGFPPIVSMTDATPAFLQEEYNWPISEERFEAERDSYQKAAMIVFSSNFMLRRAMDEFPREIAHRPVHAITMGLNMDTFPDKPKYNDRKSGSIRLLFVGKDWVRKNGSKFLDIKSALERKNYRVHATIVGCQPSALSTSDSVAIYPYLDKNNLKDRETYESILVETDFFILPTRADCSPMVIAEANAFGVPALVSDVGGIPDLVTDDQNGYLFSLDSTAEHYAEKIHEIVRSPSHYRRLRESTYSHFVEKLTWQSHAGTLSRLLHQASGKHGETPKLLKTG